MRELGCVAVAGALVYAACGAGEPSGTADGKVAVRDSAGIRIVEHAVDPWTAAPEWRLEAEPLLDLGVVEGDPDYMFHRVRGATRLADGRIVIANGGSSELRWYAPDGGFLLRVGRDGEGPGEFRSPSSLWRIRGDTLAVFDARLQRVTLFTPNGQFVRTASLQPTLLNPIMRGALSGPAILLSQFWIDVPETGTAMQFMHLFRYRLDGTADDSLGTYPWRRLGRLPSVDRVGGPALQPGSVAVGAGDRVYVGTAQANEFEILGPGGAKTVVRWAGDDLSVTEDDRGAYRAQRLGSADSPDEERAIHQMIEASGFSETRPAYEWFDADVAGNLWVQTYRRPGLDEPYRWAVFAPDGRILGRLETPDSAWILEIGEDYVLAVVRDELDVEHVRLHRLVKVETTD